MLAAAPAGDTAVAPLTTVSAHALLPLERPLLLLEHGNKPQSPAWLHPVSMRWFIP